MHLLNDSRAHVSWIERKQSTPKLQPIYQAPNESAARSTLSELAESPQGRPPLEIAAPSTRHWEHLAPMHAYPNAVRRLLCSTNSIESLHRTLRKARKIYRHIPTDDVASMLLYLALRNAVIRLGPPRDWRLATQHITLLFGDPMPTIE